MDNRYKIFKEEINCVLELIDNYDSDFLSIYRNIIDNMYYKAFNSLSEPAKQDLMANCNLNDQFKIRLPNYEIEYMDLVTGVLIDIVRKEKYFKADINIQAIYDENLSYLNLFTISVRNMKNVEDRLQFDYVQKENGEYELVNHNINPDKSSINFDWTVDLLREDDKYFLLFKKWHRGAELESKQIEINQEEVWECLDIADEYEEDEEDDLENEFDFTEEDFDGYDYN